LGRQNSSIDILDLILLVDYGRGMLFPGVTGFLGMFVIFISGLRIGDGTNFGF
jgi:hypothetical protein